MEYSNCIILTWFRILAILYFGLFSKNICYLQISEREHGTVIISNNILPVVGGVECTLYIT